MAFLKAAIFELAEKNLGLWSCGRVDVWTCGRVDVWTCGRVDRAPVDGRYTCI